MNLIRNGSFETPDPPAGGFTQIPAGTTALRPWKVGRGGVDAVDTALLEAAAGASSLDLNRLAAGTIKQGFETVIGQSYTLTFKMAGNFVGGDVVKNLVVKVGGERERFSFDTTGKTATDMGWETQSVTFVASAERTVLSFTSLEPDNAWGAMIDDVSVEASGRLTTDLDLI